MARSLSRFQLYCQYLTSSIDVPDAFKTNKEITPAIPPRPHPNIPPTAIPLNPRLILYIEPATVPAARYSKIDDFPL